MTAYVLDWCTLLNLRCGWGSIANLRDFQLPFKIGEVVSKEAIYVREFDQAGAIVPRNLSPNELYAEYPLDVLKLSSLEEQDLMVKLVARVDDGEAEGLALAACRGMSFCSDDRRMLEAAKEFGISTPIVSTSELLQAWAGTNSGRLTLLPSIVQRISVLGKFCPHKSSPHLVWWKDQMNR